MAQSGLGRHDGRMKQLFIATLLLLPWSLSDARPVLPAAGFDALYPAYLRMPGSSNRMLVFGGEGAGGKANDAIYELTFSRPTASASWRARGVLGVARREPEIAVFPGTTVVAIIGGLSSHGSTLDAIETFDYASGATTLVATRLPAGLVHHQVVPCGAGPRVLVIGGDDGNAAVASLTVIELDAAAPERSTVAPLRDVAGRKVMLKTARNFGSAVALDDANSQLLVAGGETRSGEVLSDSELVQVTTECVVQRIRPTSPLTERRTRGALTRSATGSAIYYAGWDGDLLALDSLIYDAQTNAWHTGAPLPQGYGRMRPPHAINDTVIAIAGGDIGTPQGPAVSASNWAVYFPENGGEWMPGDAPKNMRQPRVGNVVAFLDGALITVFGQDTTSTKPFEGLDTPE